MPRNAPSMHDVLNALDWVRREMWRSASPDFIRQRVAEGRVQQLCAKLLSGGQTTKRSKRRQQRT